MSQNFSRFLKIFGLGGELVGLGGELVGLSGELVGLSGTGGWAQHWLAGVWPDWRGRTGVV